MNLSLFTTQIVNSLVLGGVYALLSISLTFLYSVSGVLQLAQADVMVVGAYCGYLTTLLVPNLVVGVLVGTLVTGLLGLAIYEGIFRWMRNSGHLILVAGLALSSLIEESLKVIFLSGHPVAYGQRVVGNGSSLGFQLLLLGLAVAIGAAFQIFLMRSRWGRALRATADDHETARLLGIPVNLMVRLSFVISSALAGGAGVLLAVIFQYITPFIGGQIEFTAVAVILFGGLGSIPGAIIGSFILATSQVFATTYLSSSYQDAITFGLIVLILVFRPKGLFSVSREVRA